MRFSYKVLLKDVQCELSERHMSEVINKNNHAES